MAVDGQHKIKAFLAVLSSEGVDKAREALQSLGPTSREIFARGLKSIDEPKELLEEHLYAVLLRQRLHFERRLPLLAVIATAAPLMGLLGTVMGMVKTFALITVFGTGNAGKLASASPRCSSPQNSGSWSPSPPSLPMASFPTASKRTSPSLSATHSSS